MTMPVLETERLSLRRFVSEDAPFILRLLNEPLFLRFIGERNVRTVADAEKYIAGLQAGYDEFEFGLYLVQLRPELAPIGMCGLMKKPWLEAPDIAYAFVPESGGQGLASEAAAAVLELGRTQYGMKRVLGVVTHDNAASIRILEKLGFMPEGTVVDPRSDTELRLYEYRDSRNSGSPTRSRQ